MTVLAEEALFKSAADALRFAFNFSHQQYDRPLMNRLAGGESGSGKGLSGLDGAGQAGMIRRELSGLSNLYRAALIAQYAPRTFECTCNRSCCVGKTINFEWREAVNTLASYSCELVQGGEGKFRLRRDLVFRLYGSGETFASIAEECGVTERTVSTHSSELSVWLRGTNPKGDPKKKKTGIEEAAYLAAHSALFSAGMVGNDDSD